MYLFLLQISSQAFQSNFISFGNGYKFALPANDAAVFGCTIPNGNYQVRGRGHINSFSVRVHCGPASLELTKVEKNFKATIWQPQTQLVTSMPTLGLDAQ